jgi:hypothetical protein
MSWADILAAIQATELSQAIRYSQWRYAVVNTAHILGIALLVGAILPMDLRLLGGWRRIPHPELARVLVPVAATGLAIAMTAGICLFVVRAKEYGVHPLFQIKVPLVLLGATAALVFHARAGLWLDRATSRQARLHGALSLGCWVGALVLGRMIAYWR